MSAALKAAEDVTPQRMPAGKDSLSHKKAVATPSIQSIPRQAWPGDIKDSQCGRSAKQVWAGLCEHRNKTTGLSWPKVSTLARELSIDERTVQRALHELVQAGWVGMPFGDVGGASNRVKDNEDGTRRYSGVQYHLHPNGKPCLFCTAAARTLNRWHFSKGDNKSPLERPPERDNSAPKGDKDRSLRVTEITPKGDKSDSAYKEGTFSIEPSLKEPSLRRRSTTPEVEVSEWSRISDLIGQSIDHQARGYIQTVLRDQNLTLADFAVYLGRNPLPRNWRNRIAGLRCTAERLQELLSDLEWELPRSTSESPLFSAEDLRLHLSNAARACRGRPEQALTDIAISLERLVERAEEHARDLEPLEQALTALETRTVLALQNSATHSLMQSVHESLNRELKPYRGKMTAEQMTMLERRYVEAALLERAKIPRLSLFYLH